MLTHPEPCLYVVPASGGDPAEVWCGRVSADFHGWSPDGLLVVTEYFGEIADYVLIDPAAGREVSRVPVPRDATGGTIPLTVEQNRSRRIDGTEVFTESTDEGDAAVFIRHTDNTGETLISAGRAPRDYAFLDAQWSPDGNWVLVSDPGGRLIIARATGQPNPRVVAESTEGWGWAWFIPGNATYTIEIPGR